MNGKNILIGGFAVGLAVASALSFSDGDRDWGTSATGVRPVTNPLYAAECGSCHFAYQPGLLPARSWEKMMAGLDDHFGENAELGPDVLATLTDYLVANAAETDPGWVAKRIEASAPNGATSLRISEQPYIVHKHDEIPPRMVRDNADVGSLSNCTACHTRADKGAYNEDTVRIPGYPYWED